MSNGSTETKEEATTLDRLYDCAVIGGGPAGLSAAIYMGRMNRSVIVVDSEQGRSMWHQLNHNYLGFPEGVHARELRKIGEKQASNYGVVFLDARANATSYEGNGPERRFTIETTEGTVTARTLIICTGVRDKFPEFDGSDACIGRSIFWCIICDGYEAIDKRVVVLGSGSRAASLALEILQFTPQVTLVSWKKPIYIEPARLNAMKEHGIKVYDSQCMDYVCATEGKLAAIKLENGTEVPLDMLFVTQHIEPNNELANQLDLMVDENGFIVVDAEQATNVEGAYAAGDITRLYNHQVTSAVHEGGMAAAAANYYLYEDWQKD